MNHSNNQSMLSLHDVSIGYRTSRKSASLVASGLNETLQRGEFVCLLGPNGAGKSTLLRTVAGMQAQLSGTVAVEGKSIKEITAKDLAKRLSVVLTDRVSGELLSVYALVSLGRYPHTNWAGGLTKKDQEIIQNALVTMGVDHFRERHLGELSDGERQRVMVARALAQQPRIMILDEITAFLDLPRRVEVMQLLRKMAHDSGLAILISTHDLDLALRTADRLWVITKEGSLITGAPEDLVLEGTFAAAFASEGLEFDSANGHFILHKETVCDVRLIGSGEAARWTTRALERQGFNVTDQDESYEFLICIGLQDERPCWSLTDQSGTSKWSSIYELSSTLKRKSRMS